MFLCFIAQLKVNLTFHLEIKVPEFGGRVWCIYSQWWWGLCHLLVLVHCDLTEFKSKVNAASTRRLQSTSRLHLLTGFMEMLISFSSRTLYLSKLHKHSVTCPQIELNVKQPSCHKLTKTKRNKSRFILLMCYVKTNKRKYILLMDIMLLNVMTFFYSAVFQPVSQQLCSAVTLHQSSITNDNVTWPTQHRRSLLPRVLASVR